MLGIDRGSISKCCRQKAISVNNTFWCFVKDYDTYNIKPRSANYSRETAVYQLDKLTGQFIAEYKSISEAARAVGHYTSCKHIAECCKGERKSAFGYKWSYKNEERTN